MEQVPYPGPKLSWHIRIVSLFGLLFMVDVFMFLYSVESTLINGVGGMVLFATEVSVILSKNDTAIPHEILVRDLNCEHFQRRDSIWT